MSLALAHTLAALYAPEERLIARTLVRLFKVGGDETAARNHQRTADYATSREALRQQALLLMEINKDDWGQGRCRQATQLLRAAGEQMLLAYPFEETLDVFEAAYQLACRTGVAADQAHAIFCCGVVLLESGNYPAAREKFNRSLEINQQIGDRIGEAATWHNLATIDVNEGNYPAAKEKFNCALEIYRQIGHRWGEAATFAQLGYVVYEQGGLVEGTRLMALSFSLLQAINHSDTPVFAKFLTEKTEQLNYTPEQIKALLAEVAQEYARDRGARLVRAVFGEN